MEFARNLALFTLLLVNPAQAQQDVSQGRIEIDTNLFCDTQQQVERFVSLVDAGHRLAPVTATARVPDPSP